MTIAFTCARCGRQFQPAGGGQCAICGQILCASHLTRRGTPSPACDACAPDRFPLRQAWRRIWGKREQK